MLLRFLVALNPTGRTKLPQKAEQGKLQNINFEEKKITRKWNGVKSYIQRDKFIKKWNKGSGDFRARSYPVKFPTWEKELNKSLELGVVEAYLEAQHWEDRDKWISEFEASLV